MFKTLLMKVVLLFFFRKENHFQEDPIEFWPPKLTLKTENYQFLAVMNQNTLQDINKFF